MKVRIDDTLTVECSHLLNGGETWNGWVLPVFTSEQVETLRGMVVALGWYSEDGRDLQAGDSPSFSECVTNLGYGEYVVEGWTWEVVPADCEVCGTDSDTWGPDGCTCWWCRSCKATNPEGDNECRSCHTSFCTDCGRVIEWREDLQGWDGDHVEGCFMAYPKDWAPAN